MVTFTVSHGQIIDPDGKVWDGYGVAVYDADVQFFGANLTTTLLKEFPGISVVRVAVSNFGYLPSSYATFVNAMTKGGAAVVFENHNDQQTVLTGSALTTESNWYAGLASYYITNPYVMFQTMNEPGSGDSAQQQATYNAIRGSGSNSIIFMEAGTGAGGGDISSVTPSVYASMHNVAWDIHAYDWQSNYSTSVATIQADQNQRIANFQSIHSADGVMPAISLETGQATNGTTIDPGGAQEIQATYTNPNFIGAVAWAWDNWGTPGLVNSLTNSKGNTVTGYGQEVASYIVQEQTSRSGTPTSTMIGNGPDNLTLKVSEDAYLGDAQYTISMDGQQIGGTLTSHASHALGQDDTVVVLGDWALGTHTATISFLNDASSGTASTDRNLYVDGATYNGSSVPGSTLTLHVTGPASFSFLAPPTPVNTTIGSGSEALVLKVSEDYYLGNANYTVKVDGKEIGGTLTAHARHSLGQDDTLTVLGNWASGSHTATIDFLNDAWGGTASTDRNLYVDGATYKGAAVSGGHLSLYVTGTESFIFK